MIQNSISFLMFFTSFDVIPLTFNSLSVETVFRSEKDLTPASYNDAAFLTVIPGIFENTVTASSLDNDTGAVVTSRFFICLGSVGGDICEEVGVVAVTVP